MCALPTMVGATTAPTEGQGRASAKVGRAWRETGQWRSRGVPRGAESGEAQTEAMLPPLEPGSAGPKSVQGASGSRLWVPPLGHRETKPTCTVRGPHHCPRCPSLQPSPSLNAAGPRPRPVAATSLPERRPESAPSLPHAHCPLQLVSVGLPRNTQGRPCRLPPDSPQLPADCTDRYIHPRHAYLFFQHAPERKKKKA